MYNVGMHVRFLYTYTAAFKPASHHHSNATDNAQLYEQLARPTISDAPDVNITNSITDGPKPNQNHEQACEGPETMPRREIRDPTNEKESQRT